MDTPDVGPQGLAVGSAPSTTEPEGPLRTSASPKGRAATFWWGVKKWRLGAYRPVHNDPTTRKLMNALRCELPRSGEMGPGHATNAEALVLLQGKDTAAANQEEQLPVVARHIEELAAAASDVDETSLAVLDCENEMHIVQKMEDDVGKRRQMRYADDSPLMRHFSREEVMAITVFLVVVDAAFLYLLFARDFNSNVALFAPERLGAMLIAALPPLGGMIVARVGGRALSRWHHASKDRARHRLPAVVGLVLSLVVAAGAGALINWRFSDAALGAVLAGDAPRLPGMWVGMIFAATLLSVVLLHGFLENPLEYEYRLRDKELALRKATIAAAQAAHRRAHTRKEQALQVLLDDAVALKVHTQHIIATVEGLVLQGRALDPHAPMSTPWKQPDAEKDSCDWSLNLGAPEISLPLVQRILEVVQRYGVDNESFCKEAGDLARQVAVLEARYRATDGAQRDVQRPGTDGAQVVPLHSIARPREDVT